MNGCRNRNRAALLLFLAMFPIAPAAGEPAAEPAAPCQTESSPQLAAAQEPMRNPFLPAESVRGRLKPPPRDPSQFRLEAVLSGRGRPRALISGQVVGVGDPFYDYSVSEIGADRVSLQRDNQEIRLHLRMPYEGDP